MKTFTIFQYWAVLLFALTNSCQGQKKTEPPVVRQPAVAGTFYPSDPGQLKSQLDEFFRTAGLPEIKKSIAAVIVPHAGYVFSGKVAASAFAQLDPEKKYSRVFVIASSHYVYLKGAAVYNSGDFKTPLGIVEVDKDLANQLISKYDFFENSPEAHAREHSIEVQLPFLQHHLKNNFKIVPIVIGTNSEATCGKIADALRPYFNEENLFVISTDFSHYPSYQGALKADKVTGDAIAANTPAVFLQAIEKNYSEKIPGLSTSCCAWTSVLTLLNLSSQEKGMEVHHIKYANSGDTPYGDSLRVVGYHSFVLTRDLQNVSEKEFSLSKEEKILLLKSARSTIENLLHNVDIQSFDESVLPQALKEKCGAFVTLKKDGKLRGCIGQFKPSDPLYKVVQRMAEAAAFDDSRFRPVQKEEMKDIEIEISVLTPLKKIKSIDEIVLGKHGIYMMKGGRSGTFLPQVADETGWTKEQFLGHCAEDKAGIGWNGWKDAELFTYEALVFSEDELKK